MPIQVIINYEMFIFLVKALTVSHDFHEILYVMITSATHLHWTTLFKLDNKIDYILWFVHQFLMNNWNYFKLFAI